MIIMVIRNWFGDVAPRGASKYLSITIRICNDRVEKPYDDKNESRSIMLGVDPTRSIAIIAHCQLFATFQTPPRRNLLAAFSNIFYF